MSKMKTMALYTWLIYMCDVVIFTCAQFANFIFFELWKEKCP